MPRSINKQFHSWTPLGILIVILILLYLLWKVVVVFILAAFLAFLIFPLVQLLDRRLPHIFSIISTYLFIAIILTVILGFLVPVVVTQFEQFAHNIPTLADKIRLFVASLHVRFGALPAAWQDLGEKVLSEAQQGVIRLTREGINMLLVFFTSLLTLVIVPLLAFFMLLNYQGYKRMVVALTPERHRHVIDDLLFCMSRVLWTFFKGEFILMAVVGVADSIGLIAIGMPYAVVLGILGGLLELIPSLGPTISTVVIVIVGLAVNPIMALKGGSIALIVQLLENIFLVPVVVGRTVGLDPISITFAILLGGMLAGVPGAIISVPLAMTIKIILVYFYVDRTLLPQGESFSCTIEQARRGRRRRREQPRFTRRR